jgi:hypothetical protein
MGYNRNAYSVFVRKPEGRRPLEKLQCMWENNIKIDLKEAGWDGVDWIQLA